MDHYIVKSEIMIFFLLVKVMVCANVFYHVIETVSQVSDVNHGSFVLTFKQ